MCGGVHVCRRGAVAGGKVVGGACRGKGSERGRWIRWEIFFFK